MADSIAEIQAEYAQLHVLESPPDWMSEDYVQSIRERRSLDIDDEEDEFRASSAREASRVVEAPQKEHRSSELPSPRFACRQESRTCCGVPPNRPPREPCECGPIRTWPRSYAHASTLRRFVC